MVSAYSLTSVSGKRSDCTASSRTGLSAGFTLRKVGGLGRVRGNWPPAALMAATSKVMEEFTASAPITTVPTAQK